ncbi:mch4p [Saccharomyces arboricola H-6]|uniref:Mch4p n=1 Tax=Saccharomyces arboricola (strain H-6 / AS 2.3317 / CBS 10644) TaxID=1160507 RepID=J8PZI1_SACAR|nr:mch4p [Saccharomyces arboricola H-6]
MLNIPIIANSKRFLFPKEHEPQSTVNNDVELEMIEGPSSGYHASFNLDDAILKKNNDQVDLDASKLTNVTSRVLGTSDDSLIYDDDREFPDGGIQAWLVVFGSFMGLIPVFGLINSLGAIESYISKHQLANISSSTTSWIFSLYLAISFLSCILSGGYFDRNGSTGLMCTGTVIYTGGLFALANCDTVWQFILAFSVLSGLGTGILMTPLIGTVATWFLKRRGIATSVSTMGGSIGGIIFPIMLRKLYKEVGFHWAIRILAFICLACLICATALAREKNKPVVQPFESRSDVMKWYVSSVFNWRYFLEGKFLFVAIGASFAESSLTSCATYLASYSMARGNTENVAYTMITASNTVGILGRYIPGYFADRFIGRFNVEIITISMAAILNFVMWLPFGGNTKVLWAYVCLWGFSTGSILSLTPVCIGQISKTTDFGKRYATVYLLQSLVTIPVLPVGGTLIGKGTVANYNHFIIFNSALMAAGAACYVISRYICVGAKLCKF